MQQPQFSSRVSEVEVYTTVTSENGRPVTGLTAADFTILEDNMPQRITAFGAGERPASVALAIDRSFSMQGATLNTARDAGRRFVNALQPSDRAMLISISGDVEVLSPLSADKRGTLAALDALDVWGTTALHDALIRSIDVLDDEAGRRAIVVLSDGVDRYSVTREADVLSRARHSDVMIYPIAVGTRRPPFFAELAAVTGGRSFHLRRAGELSAALQSIATELRAQYLLGYAPATPWSLDDDEWRSISVSVDRPGARVRARSGYSTK